MQLTLAQIASVATTFNQGRLDLSLSEVSMYANLALAEVATRLPHDSLQQIAVSSTTSGENRMDLPADFDYALTVSITSGAVGGMRKQLVERQVSWLDSNASNLGEPRYYIKYGSWLELAPSPDSSYSMEMRYVGKVRSMVSSTDTPNIAERFHYAVALKTAEICAAARNDIEQEAVNRARYLSYMGSTPSDLAYLQRSQNGMAVALQKGTR